MMTASDLRASHAPDGRDASGDRDAPERSCIVTRQTMPADDLLRFVLDPEGQIVPDIAGKLPGRGYWVTATREMVDRAVQSRSFENAAARARKGSGEPVKVDPALGQWVEDLLARRCLEYLGLACRAGQLVTGFEKVKAHLATHPDSVLVEASDGSADGRRKIMQGVVAPRRLVRRFTREQLSLALGRQNVVHAAIEATGIGARFVELAGRLERYAPAAAAEAGKGPQD